MISCQHYDYIEIACTYQYPIRLTMKNGTIIDCIAKNTFINKDRKECLEVLVAKASRLVVLDEIRTMETNVSNPHFGLVTFQT